MMVNSIQNKKLILKQQALKGIIFALSSATAAPGFAQDQTLPETVVTATRVATPVEQIGSAITVITAEELAQRQIRFVSEALRDVPGLSVSRSGGVGALTDVSIRGTNANQSLVLIDGVKVNNPDGNAFNFNSLLDVEIDRIEVLRGPASVVWGSSAIGGVINIITKKAKRPVQGLASVEGGSFGTGQFTASLGASGERYNTLLGGSYFETRGASAGSYWRGNTEDDGARIGTLNLKAGVQPAENLEFNLNGWYAKDDAEFDDFVGGIQKPVVDADLRTDTSQYTLRGSGKLTLLGGAWEHIVSAGLYDIEQDTKRDGRTSFIGEGDSTELTYQSNVFFKTPAFAQGDHTFTLLVDDQQDESENDYFQQNSIRDTGYALMYQGGFWDRLYLSAGGRYDDNDQFNNTSTYRFTGAYLLKDWGARLHTSYGKAVKNPTLTELFGFAGDFRGNPDLQPETGTGWDVGLEQSFLDDRVTADVTYFDSRIEDIIVGAGRTVVNLDGQSKASGVEASVRAELSEGLGLTGAYTYTATEDPDGEELVRRPNNVASLYLNYRFWQERANVNLGVLYTGNRDDTTFDPLTFAPARVPLEAYTLVNLKGSYRINDYLEVFGRIDNLFDEQYEDVFGYGGAEQGFFAGLKGSF